MAQAGSISQRRLAAHIRQQIDTGLGNIRNSFVNEPNTERTREAMRTRMSAMLTQLKGQNAMRDFQIEDRSTPSRIKEGFVDMVVNIQDTPAVDFIQLDVQISMEDELARIAEIIEEALGERIFERDKE